MVTERVDAAVARLAARQFGVFAREQALKLGATPTMIQRRCASGRWRALRPGVYAVTGHPPSWRRDLLAALLACGPETVASHRAAGALWRFPDLPEGPLEVSHPAVHTRRGLVIHRTTLPNIDVTRIGEIAVTTPARTLIDLAAVVPATTVNAALDDALRRGLLTVPRLMRRIESLAARGRRGMDVIRAAATQRAGIPALLQSPLESAVYDLIVGSGLPRPIPQYEVRLGGRRAFIDFAYPEAWFGIEADGYRWHAGRDAWRNDLARRNALTSAGWRILHVTDEDVRQRRHQLVAAIRTGLAA